MVNVVKLIYTSLTHCQWLGVVLMELLLWLLSINTFHRFCVNFHVIFAFAFAFALPSVVFFLVCVLFLSFSLILFHLRFITVVQFKCMLCSVQCTIYYWKGHKGHILPYTWFWCTPNADYILKCALSHRKYTKNTATIEKRPREKERNQNREKKSTENEEKKATQK